MITISGSVPDPSLLLKYPPGSVKRLITDILHSSSKEYGYRSLKEFEFELQLRDSIIHASIDLFRSRFSFKDFHDSICNEKYWERTDEGGFLSHAHVKPYDAINDIYINSYMYGTECATAIVVVYYKAVADTFPEQRFNELFPRIYLMDWQYTNNRLGITLDRRPHDYLPGDCRYFKNPDVDPLTPQWQGENVIDLGFGNYYGHGIGIARPEIIIEALNQHRSPGSETSAYLMDMVTQLGFKQLAALI